MICDTKYVSCDNCHVSCVNCSFKTIREFTDKNVLLINRVIII